MRIAAALIATALFFPLPAFALSDGADGPSYFYEPAQQSEASPTVFTPGRAATSPDVVLVPLADAPFTSMINPGSSVTFDFVGGGEKRAQGWTTTNAAMLVWDPSWRGDVQSGVDVLGARTWSMVWSNGFQALAALDTNHDGQLTGDELGGLALWRDANCDGISEPDEVMPVEAHGIVGLSTHGTAARPGLVTASSGVRFDNGRSRPLYDWTPGSDIHRAHLF